MSTYKHGVYISEQATSLTPPIEGTAGLQVIIGTAPINMVDNPSAAVNTPKICYSFAEAVAAVGYSDDFEKYTACQSVDASFRVFNVAPIVIINVLDPSKAAHVTTVAASDIDVSNKQAIIEEFGVLKSTVVVKAAGGTGSAYVADEDYTLSFDNDGNLIVTILSSGSIGQSVTSLNIAYSKLNPSGVTASDIIGSVDAASGATTGLECLNKIYPMFGLTPGLILAPGFSHNANVIAAMEAKCAGINGCFSAECICDIDTVAANSTGTTATSAVLYSAVNTAKQNLGLDSPHAIACWPKACIGDKQYYMSALVGALIAYTDATNGDVPSLYPSNKSIQATGLCLADGTKVIIDQEQANLVNSYGVVTAINYNGFKCWGNNTAAYPSTTDPKDRWLAVRRFFTWWGNSLILTYHQKVDASANYRLIENIVDSENIRGNNFVARGICAEAHVEFLESENPITSILNGQVVFHMCLSPYTPAENIRFTLEFNPEAIQTALTGGNE